MKKYYRLTENDLNRLLKKVLNEQPTVSGTGNPGTNIRPEESNFTPGKTITLDSTLFSNGISKIDTSNQSYINAIKYLSGLPNGTNVLVTGGASAVGGTSFDNKKLAENRAKNFINAVKNDGVTNLNFQVSSTVGVATVKNSQEARKEQFVKIEVKTPSRFDYQTAIDKTGTRKPLDLNPNIKYHTITIKVNLNKKERVLGALRSLGLKYPDIHVTDLGEK